LTAETVENLKLNDRQKLAIPTIRQQGHVSNREYQVLTKATRPSAKRDLEDLVKKGVVVPIGKGRGAFYSLAKKRLINGSNGSRKRSGRNGS
jgi:ATP-dependent DNA helicase RecG